MTRRPRSRRSGAARPTGPALEAFAFTLPDGRQGLYVGESIRETDPAPVREGLVRRRVLATTGRCPCGAESPFDPAVIPAGLAISAVVHAADCPAAESNLTAARRAAR